MYVFNTSQFSLSKGGFQTLLNVLGHGTGSLTSSGRKILSKAIDSFSQDRCVYLAASQTGWGAWFLYQHKVGL